MKDRNNPRYLSVYARCEADRTCLDCRAEGRKERDVELAVDADDRWTHLCDQHRQERRAQREDWNSAALRAYRRKAERDRPAKAERDEERKRRVAEGVCAVEGCYALLFGRAVLCGRSHAAIVGDRFPLRFCRSHLEQLLAQAQPEKPASEASRAGDLREMTDEELERLLTGPYLIRG